MASFPVKIRLGGIDRLSGTLKKVTGGLNKMKSATQRASNSFKLFQDKTKRLRATLAKAGGAMKSAGRGMMATVTAPIVGMGVAIIATAARFEKSMNKVKALTGATGESFTSMRELAKKLGAETQFSASEAADAMSFLGMAGWNTNQILAGTPAILDLAAASGTDLAATADIASNIMGAFGLKAEEMGRVADILARTTAGSNVSMEQLADTMKFAAPIAKQFGASLEETSAAAGLLGNIGIQGTSAGTALKNMFLGLSAPTTKAAKLLEAMGVDVFDETKNKMRGFSDVMKQLGGKLGKLPADAKLAVLKELFGKIGIAGGAAMQEFAATGQLDKFIDKMSDTTITAKVMAKTMNEGAAGSMKSLQSAMEGLAISIADSGILKEFTDIVKSTTKFVRDLSKSNPKLFKMGAMFAIVAASIGPVLFIFGSLVTMIPGLIALFGLLSGATLAALWPFLLIAGAVIAFIALAALIIKNWDDVVLFFKFAFGGIADTFMGLLGMAQMLIDDWDILGPAFGKLFDELMSDSIKGITGMWDGLKQAPGLIKAIWAEDDLPFFFKTLWGFIADEFTKGVATIKGIVDEFNLIGDFLKQEVGINSGQVVPDAPTGIATKLRTIREKKEREFVGPPEFVTPTPAGQSAGRAAAGKVTVDFKNLPKGTTIKTESTDKEIFDINTGLQGAAS